MRRPIGCYLIIMLASLAAGERSAVAAEAATPAAVAAAPGDLSRTSRGVPYDYKIGAGDVLQISVWKEPDASVPSVVVRPDGMISLPLVKDVSVLGLTPKRAEATIAEELRRFITDADVTLVVAEINSKKVYLVGALKKEGPVAYTYRMSVIQAISEGGGLTDYAKRKKIYVLRNEDGRQTRVPFNYDAVIKGEHMEMNIALLPDDTVVVPH